MITILKKQRQDVVSCDCILEAERADAVPAVFTKITMDFQVSGNNLDQTKVKRAVALSAEKYCSASIMLGKSARITHDYEIHSSSDSK